MAVIDLIINEKDLIKTTYEPISQWMVLIKFELKTSSDRYIAAMQRCEEWNDFDVVAYGYTERCVLFNALNIVHSKLYILQSRIKDFCDISNPFNEKFYFNRMQDSFPQIKTNFESIKIEDNKVILEY